MRRREFLAAAGRGAAGVAIGAGMSCSGTTRDGPQPSSDGRAIPGRPPNLLFIYTDEQACGTLACYGNRLIETPNLDRLAGRATVFDQAYVTQPVCTPSRSSLLTGLWPHTSGCTENNVPLRPETPCLPEMITGGDYATGHFGKWHLGDEIFAQHGFDEWVSIEDGYRKHYGKGRDRDARSDYHRFLVASGHSPRRGDSFSRGEAARLPEQYGKPAFLAREAARFIREKRDRPFALYVNFLEPHMPFFGPRDNQYRPKDVPLPPNFRDAPDETMPLRWRVLREAYAARGHSGLPLKSESGWRRLIANYWGLCSLVDTHVGTILGALEACGLWDETIIVFTSDHGDMMGSHQLVAKCVMYEEAVRVPMIVKLPGQVSGKRVAGPVSQIDVVPSLLDLLGPSPRRSGYGRAGGQPVPGHLQGKSLRPVLEQDEPRATGDVVVEWSGPNNGLGNVSVPRHMAVKADPSEIRASFLDPVRTIVTPEGWKLCWSPLGEHVLFNLRDDPLETRNLYGDARHRDVAAELRGRIASWQEEMGDEVRLPEMG
ncbi:MAG: sulfatase family protein [Planctomycetota bacterium]|jgi:arylsulfatase A-like enzyme